VVVELLVSVVCCVSVLNVVFLSVASVSPSDVPDCDVITSVFAGCDALAPVVP